MEILIGSIFGEVGLKLILAVVLGGLLGLERSLAHKTAGMRTYTLVALGAATFVIVGELVADSYLKLGVRTFDPLRMASQVIVGIGFLGAGLIITQNNKLYGLTTAAGLWVAAALGAAVGFGFYVLAGLVTVLALIIFTILWHLERFIETKAGTPISDSQLSSGPHEPYS